MKTHKRFICPVSHENRDMEKCATCVECAGGKNRCGLQTTKHGRILDSAHIAKRLQKKKEAEEAYESSKKPPKSPAENLAVVDVFNTVHAVLNTLKEREAEVMSLRFGLNGGKPMTLEEVGQKLGITRERVRQIEVKALRKLRHPARLKRLMEVR